MLIIELFGGLAGLLLLGKYLVKKVDTDIALRDAETYIRNHSALYRHYNIRGVQDILQGKIGSQCHIATISDSQVIDIVSRVRSEKGMGPIPYHYLPDYANKE